MGLRSHAAAGSKIGHIPIGYVVGGAKGRPAKDSVLAPVVTELFQRADRGDTINALRRWFSEATGHNVDNRTIRRVLGNPYYMGLNVNFRCRDSIVEGGKPHARPREEWVKVRHDQQLIDEPTWLRVQARLATHANVGQQRERVSAYALQGLLRCMRCDRRMQGRTKVKGRLYRCPVCNMERGLVKIERATRACLGRLQLDAGEAAIVLDRMVGERRRALEEQLSEAGQQIGSLTKKRMRIYERWDKGLIDQEQYREQIADVDAERGDWRQRESTLTAQLAAQPQTAGMVADVAADQESWLYWPDKIPVMAMEDQQNVYRECVKAATIDAVANTLTVEYTPHIALLMGGASHSVAL